MLDSNQTEKLGFEARHVGKLYGSKVVLKDVSLHVKKGEVVGLLGPNGAGKTTCFYIMTGLIKANSGTVLIDGIDITRLPMYRRSRLGVAYLPQEASIFRGMNVEENIIAILELHYKNRDEILQRCDQLLEEFSIAHIRKTPALALSGGERRRTEIARALATNPDYILLDEPLAGIDPLAVNDLRDLIGQLKQRNIGVLVTDHNVRDMLEIVDRGYILYEGRVLMDGGPKKIVNHKDVKRVYLGERFKL